MAEGNEQQEPQEQQGIDYDKLASILDGRMKATEESVLKGYFKEQGLTGDEMAQAVQAFKESRASKEPDVSGMQASIAELQRQIEEANAKTLKANVENAVVVEATKLGVDPKAIPYLTRMGDFSDAASGGTVDASKVAAAIGKVLEDLPQLKPSAAEQKGFRIGGDGKDGMDEPDESKLARALGVKPKKS